MTIMALTRVTRSNDYFAMDESIKKHKENSILSSLCAYSAYSARTAHPFQRNGALFRFKLSKAQQVY